MIKAPAGACARDSTATGGCAEIGQEIEVYNLLIIDQHSFAGTPKQSFWLTPFMRIAHYLIAVLLVAIE